MAFLEIDRRAQALRRGRGPEGHRPRGRGGRVPGAGRPLGLRQVHPAQHHRRPRDDHRGRDPHRRPPGQRAASQGPRHRHGVPVLRALPEHDGRAEHHLRHGDARRAQGRARQGGAARSRRCCRSASCWTASPASSPAASASASPWAGRWCATPSSSCSTSRCPISTPSCASRCAPRSRSCTSGSARPSSTSPTTRSRR